MLNVRFNDEIFTSFNMVCFPAALAWMIVNDSSVRSSSDEEAWAKVEFWGIDLLDKIKHTIHRYFNFGMYIELMLPWRLRTLFPINKRID